nr:S8 family serine peptidase [Pseudobdellovibrionaceae bacterium]
APCASALGNAFVKLSSQGILLIVAAGNSGIDIDQYPVYPASFLIPNQLTVAASTSLDFMASWSNNGYQGTHLAAPGAQILSTVPGNSYGYMDGTSMAAPFVTGAAAVLWSARPDASAAEIRQALIRSVDISPGHEFRVASRGRLNLRKALEELQRIRP